MLKSLKNIRAKCLGILEVSIFGTNYNVWLTLSQTKYKLFQTKYK